MDRLGTGVLCIDWNVDMLLFLHWIGIYFKSIIGLCTENEDRVSISVTTSWVFSQDLGFLI